MTGKPIYICSDGGASDTSGSYAAEIASKDRILISLSGEVGGDYPGSF